MKIVQTVKHHQATTIKSFLVIVAIVIFLVSIQSWANSNKVAQEQQIQANAAIANHTQTLNEIQNAVTQLKASNQADHTVTIKYINCVLVGITQSNPPNDQAAILAVYKQCLANSQIPGTPTN